MPTTIARLTHEQIKSVLPPGRMVGKEYETQCPLCFHTHLRLFDKDQVKCENGCPTTDLITHFREKLAHTEKSKVLKPSELPDWNGFTLKDYSELKCLSGLALSMFFGVWEKGHPIDGSLQTTHSGKTVVAFPYMDAKGKVLATKIRLSHDSHDTYFRPKDPHIPYGLWLRTNRPDEKGSWPADIVLCEGESNTQTFLAHHIPALGISGSNGWRTEFASLPVIQNAKRVFIAKDPDQGGEAFAAKIRRDVPAEKLFVLEFQQPLKDVSEMHIFAMGHKGPVSTEGIWIDAFNDVASEAILSSEPISTVEEKAPPLPTFTGTVHDLAEAIAPGLPYEYKVAALFTVVGAMLTRKVQLEGAPHIQPRLFTCLIGGRGSGKSGANFQVKEAVKGLLEAHQVHLLPSIDSEPGFVCSLKQHPRTLLDPDELSGLFEKTRDAKQGIFNQLLKLHDQNVTGNNAKGNIKLLGEQEQTVRNAEVSILSGATTEGFPELWTGVSAKRGGLQSRFTLVTSDAGNVLEPQPEPDYVRVGNLVEQLESQIDSLPEIIMYPESLRQRQFEWSGTVEKGSRAPAFVTRILLILAVTNDLDTITDEILTQALAFGDYQIAVHKLLMPEDASNWTQANENRILTTFKKHGLLGLTQNQVRRFVSPNKHPGGVGPFLMAWSNLVRAGYLRSVDETQRSPIYVLESGTG